MDPSAISQDWRRSAAGGVEWLERGRGRPVLFLHGNWDHLMYLPMLESLGGAEFRVLVQRGVDCWRRPGTYNALPLAAFISDIERFREATGGGRLAIIGHSWGASLALHYAAEHPRQIDRLMLIGMGPLSDAMSRFYKANVRKMVHPDRLGELDAVAARWSEQFGSGQGVSAELDRQYAHIYKMVWAYSAGAAERIAQQYLDSGGYRRVAAGALRTAPEPLLAAIGAITAPVTVVYGYQDYEPITQAYMIRERIAHARLEWINECGHLPWLDRADEFARVVGEWLGG